MRKILQRLEEIIKRTRGVNKKEELQQVLEHCKEVDEDLRIIEMELIWYIRQSNKYYVHSYLIIAKKIYESELTFKKLTDAAHITDIDKK